MIAILLKIKTKKYIFRFRLFQFKGRKRKENSILKKCESRRSKVFDILKITKDEVEVYFASTFYRKPKFSKAKWTTLLNTQLNSIKL